jgi:MtfA peptidase
MAFRTEPGDHHDVSVGRTGGALTQALRRIFTPRRARRRAILAQAVPRPWLEFFEARSDHYRRLPPPQRTEFQNQVRIFLSEKRITGVQIAITDEIKLLVAVSAVTLTVGWPGYTWDRLAEVIVYPDSFDRDYRLGRHVLAGQAHPWGVVILSAPALCRSFDESRDDFHLGYHEFAHLFDRSQTGGIPVHLSDDAIRQWGEIMQREDERLRNGTSVLNPYALSAPNELFAVAVETFFQRPVALMDSHRELYSFLAGYFQQDPAAWARASL